ncbi:MAG: Gfo/Idh/MocA family oxidoreductase, partial [Tepidisphaeraceae bacterium]
MQSESNISTTRRGFLKASAAAGTVAALGANFAHAAGSDIIKVGVIGCGGRGSGATGNCVAGAKGAGAQVQIVAVGDAFINNAKGLAGKHKVPDDKVFAGLDAYKKVLDAGVDMVILATPPGFRPYHFQAAIEAGKHVFFEKPVAVDPTGVRIVMKASEMADQKKLGVVAGTQRRHELPFQETIKRVHDGAIGDVLYMRIHWDGGGIWYR